MLWLSLPKPELLAHIPKVAELVEVTQADIKSHL